jgi:pimeloyl-ACP methyl ester carboxylesterase
MVRHLTALGAYRPRPPATLPETLVVWGRGDRSVALADHLELARRTDGLLVPLDRAGHLPFLEAPEAFAAVLRLARRRAAAAPMGEPWSKLTSSW